MHDWRGAEPHRQSFAATRNACRHAKASAKLSYARAERAETTASMSINGSPCCRIKIAIIFAASSASSADAMGNATIPRSSFCSFAQAKPAARAESFITASSAPSPAAAGRPAAAGKNPTCSGTPECEANRAGASLSEICRQNARVRSLPYRKSKPSTNIIPRPPRPFTGKAPAWPNAQSTNEISTPSSGKPATTRLAAAKRSAIPISTTTRIPESSKYPICNSSAGRSKSSVSGPIPAGYSSATTPSQSSVMFAYRPARIVSISTLRASARAASSD